MVDDFFQTLEPGTVLFYCDYESERDIEHAKEYCEESGLRPEHVAIRIRYSKENPDKKESVIVVKK